MARFRRNLEAIYLIGPWPSGIGGRTSLVEAAGTRSQSGAAGTPGRYGHPHAKPVDVMETLIQACPPGTIADPFAGVRFYSRRCQEPRPARDRRGA